ncbi:DUF6153 family protein [Blastococcus sp. HT6-30]|uniref:DUF6153 family protein n=1 Tax=Blastococcus sp. HT6-30 TaxID=3144843 RepID=UPI00321ADBDB
MATRLWTALLLLAAVFAMHGVQCVASDPDMEHWSSSLAAVSSVGGHTAAVHLTAAAGTPDRSDVAAADGVRDAAATASTGLPAPWHDAHVLAVCLAVLLAGVIVLGAVARLRGRAIPLVRGSPRRGRRFTAWSLRPRSPDLSVLCLLRI